MAKCDVHNIIDSNDPQPRLAQCSEESIGTPRLLRLPTNGKLPKESKRKSLPKINMRARVCNSHFAMYETDPCGLMYVNGHATVRPTKGG